MKRHGRIASKLAGWIAAVAIASAAPRQALAKEPPKRAVPDYDGKGGDPTTTEDVLLWIPRVLLSPLYFVSEYLIRRPLGAVISGAENAKLPESLYDFFAFGPDHKAGFAPYAFVDFGFSPSVGVYLFWNDAGFKGQDLSLHAAIWTSDWIGAGFTDRIHFGKTSSFALSATGVRRPDYAFFGLGPRSLQANVSRYKADSIDVNASLDLDVWRASGVVATIGGKSESFEGGYFDADPSTLTQVDRNIFPLPPGFSRGYTLEYNALQVAFDNRRPRPASSSGVRVELDGFQGNDLRSGPASSFVRYGAQVGGFYDLNDHGRVVSLSVATQFADPLGKEPIPFDQLVMLGGYDYMRGFFPGRLLDRSAAVATLHYRWPIWSYIDGSIQLATGNVFGVHLEDLDAKLLRLSGAIGIESVGSPDNSLELLLGAGTETFEHGTQVDSVRVLFGTNRGF